MATSGSFQTSGYSDSAGSPDYCIFSWSVASQSVEGNYTVINWSLTVNGGKNEYWWNTIKERYVTVNGSTQSSTATTTTVYNNTVLFSGSSTIYHDDDGKKSFSASAGVAFEHYGSYNSTGSGTWELPVIPRYFSSAPTLICTGVTETQATFQWTTPENCSWARYHIDGSASWVDIFNGGFNGGNSSPARSGTFTISGLSANSSHSIYVECARADSKLWSNSNTTNFSTYNYPHCTSSPDFTIGDALTLEFYNPLSRSITVDGYSNVDGSIIFSGITAGAILVGFNDSNSVAGQYASIPNSQSGTYKVVVSYGNVAMTRDAGNSYKVRGNEIPTINEFDYIDNNDDTVAITGNNQHIVQNKSQLLARFHSATPNYSAGGISQYYLECNGKKANGSEEGAYELGTIDSERDVELTLTAVDSRGLSASKTIKVTMLAHSDPMAIVTLQRLNNYEDETYLTVDGSISSVNGKNTMTIQYRYKLSGGSFGAFTTIGDKAKQTLSLNKNNVYIFNIVVTDAFGSTYDKEYTLGKGLFPLFIDTRKNSIGINCFPTEEKSLEVNGFNLFNVYKCNKSILLGGADGLKITIDSFGGTDKFALIVAGADNDSMTPVFKIIHIRRDGGWTQLNLGLDSTVSVSGNNIHIKSAQWSHFTVLAPLGCEITLSNSAL